MTSKNNWWQWVNLSVYKLLLMENSEWARAKIRWNIRGNLIPILETTFSVQQSWPIILLLRYCAWQFALAINKVERKYFHYEITNKWLYRSNSRSNYVIFELQEIRTATMNQNYYWHFTRVFWEMIYLFVLNIFPINIFKQNSYIKICCNDTNFYAWIK